MWTRSNKLHVKPCHVSPGVELRGVVAIFFIPGVFIGHYGLCGVELVYMHEHAALHRHT